MKTAFNIVKFRVKPGKEKAFVDAHMKWADQGLPGGRSFNLVRTGDREFCVLGEWDNFDALVESRPMMIGNLDQIRDLLEDLGGGKGVTDPCSGEVVVSWKMPAHEVMHG